MYSVKPSQHGFNPQLSSEPLRMTRGKMLSRYPIHDLPVGGAVIVPHDHIGGLRNYMYRFKKAKRGEWIARSVVNEEGDRPFFRVVRIA